MRAPDDLFGALRGGPKGLWERLWFAEASLVRLAVVRIVTLCCALLSLHFHKKSVLQIDLANEFVTRRYVPLYFLEVLGIDAPTPQLAQALYGVLFGVLLLGILGWFTRTACAIGAVGMLVWTGWAYSYGQPHHEFGTLAFALLALPFGPVGARLSLDSAVSRWRRAGRTGKRAVPPESAANAMLPVRFIQVTAALGYLMAGMSKLRLGGSEWLNGHTLGGFMREFDAPLTDAIAGQLRLVQALSWSVVLIQVLCFVAVLWRPSRWLFVPGIIALHLGSMLTMETGSFIGLWLMQVAFIDGERVPGFLQRHVERARPIPRALWVLGLTFATFGLVHFYLQKGPALVPWLFAPVAIAALLGLFQSLRGELVYDGECAICARTISLIDALNWSGRLRATSTLEWKDVQQRHPGLAYADGLEELYFIGARRRILRGFDAYRAVAWRLPLLVPIAPLLYLPGMSWAGRRLYANVAMHRPTPSCAT